MVFGILGIGSGAAAVEQGSAGRIGEQKEEFDVVLITLRSQHVGVELQSYIAAELSVQPDRRGLIVLAAAVEIGVGPELVACR